MEESLQSLKDSQMYYLERQERFEQSQGRFFERTTKKLDVMIGKADKLQARLVQKDSIAKNKAMEGMLRVLLKGEQLSPMTEAKRLYADNNEDTWKP